MMFVQHAISDNAMDYANVNHDDRLESRYLLRTSCVISMLINTLIATPQMVCMPVQTILTSVLERVPYTAHIAIRDMIGCTIYGARRKVLNAP